MGSSDARALGQASVALDLSAEAKIGIPEIAEVTFKTSITTTVSNTLGKTYVYPILFLDSIVLTSPQRVLEQQPADDVDGHRAAEGWPNLQA